MLIILVFDRRVLAEIRVPSLELKYKYELVKYRGLKGWLPFIDRKRGTYSF